MNLLRLQADTEQALLSGLQSAGAMIQDPIGEVEGYSPRWDETCQVVILGRLTKATGVMLQDEDGNDYPECITVEGFHANVLTADESIISALAPITVYPQTPLVKFAGVE
ncbi:hypothetical protein [Alloalcanivorax xenomutans]|uniref:hypothetical protein n=1 Tax=Alloalcanivorax xenomutans TaxID=1094342 RepID=UPI003BA9A184